MTPFEPVGDEARWRIIYDVIQVKTTGDTISYDELGRALDLDPATERQTIQLSMRRAAKHSETEDKRALEAIPNQGYRIVEAEEHMRLARGQQKKAGKALGRGQSKVVNVDFNGMDPEVRKAFETVAVAFSMQMDMLRRTDVRQAHLEKVLDKIGQRGERSETEIAELRTRLEQLEASRTPEAEE